MKDNPFKDIETEELIRELNRRRTGDKSTLDEVEETLWTHRREDDAHGFNQWLEELSARETDAPQPCPRCGRPAGVNAKKRERTLLTVHGRVRYRRNYHYCEGCEQGFSPLDVEIGAPEEGQATKGLQRRAMDFAVNESYDESAERFGMHYGVSVSSCLMQSIIERLPMPEYQAQETLAPAERLTVQADGSMVPMKKGWQEAKVATVVNDRHHSPGTPQVRGQVTEARYLATMGDVSELEVHLRRVLPPRIPLKERGKTSPPEIVWVGDGARWIWKMQQRICPTAVTILDWMHAIEHATHCGRVVLDEDEDLLRLWQRSIERRLAEGNVDQVLDELRECLACARGRSQQKELKKLIRYYTENKTRMNYKEHRAQGRMIGSGMVESAHRHVIQSRMKKAGQHWSLAGAEKMARLRAIYKTCGPIRFFHTVANTNAGDSSQKRAA